MSGTRLSSAQRPLCAVGNKVLTYRGGRFWLCDEHLNPCRRLGKLPDSRPATRLLRRLPLARRLLRLDPTDGIVMEDGFVLVNAQGSILSIDLASGSVAVDWQIPNGRKALRIRRLQGIPGFVDGAVLGDYCPNPEMDELVVWSRSEAFNSDWRPLVTLPAGTANHIHDVVPDPFRGCLWILTGDFGQAPAIWRLDPDGQLQALFRGSQKDRAAVLHLTPDALYYATDTPLEGNSLYRVTGLLDQPVRSVLARIPGSVIYGVSVDSSYYFSTAVEPGMPSGTVWRDLASRATGPGILANRAFLFRLSESDELEELASAEKDSLPMVLFQFGTFHLCAAPAGGVLAYPVALRSHETIWART